MNYLDSAHITIKSLVDFIQQDETGIKTYLPIIGQIVQKWTNLMGKNTKLFGVGLFTNLHVKKGLSVGVRFYPTLPMIQIIRGEVGVALYNAQEKIQLRSEREFHTELTHSTGFRVRNLNFPLHSNFVKEFKNIVEKHDQTVFGSVSEITPSDIYIRNGYSDKLIPNAEIGVGNFS